MAKRRTTKSKRPAVKRTLKARRSSRPVAGKFECPGDCAKLTVNTLSGEAHWLIVTL
jgi:hypothetical protein